MPDAQVMGDLDAASPGPRRNGGDTGKLGITGFCWGGRITWLYAAHNPAVKAGVAWYGRLVGNADAAAAEAADRRRRRTARRRCSASTAARTSGIPLDTVEQMKAALAKGSAAAKALGDHRLPASAGHAFNADYRPSYRKDAADRRLAALPRLVQGPRRSMRR